MSELTNPTGTISSYQLMRWARQARTALMASYLQSVAIYLATSLGDCARYFGKLARRAAHELYLQNATRTLQQFDDRILADIGLRRAEIEHAVSQIGRGVSNVTLPEPPRAKPLGRIDVRGPRQICHEYSGFPTEAGLP